MWVKSKGLHKLTLSLTPNHKNGANGKGYHSIFLFQKKINNYDIILPRRSLGTMDANVERSPFYTFNLFLSTFCVLAI